MDFIRTDDELNGYTVFYSGGYTLVHCDRCGEWVFKYDKTDDMSSLDLFDAVTRAHEKLNLS